MVATLEKKYIDGVSLAHRKKFAQFFTPQSVAELMCKWILGCNSLQNVLEPAFGLGIFSRIMLKAKPFLKIKGFDIDPQIFDEAQNSFSKSSNVTLLLQDYMYNDWNNKYDGIICNPPYFKFHNYDNKGVINEIERRIGCSLNGFTNLYTLFLLKSLYQLASNGRCAYIVPSEFMNSDYGTLVKQHLIKTRMLRYVFVFDFEENIFDDALTTSCILLCANDNNTDTVAFKKIKSPADMSEIENTIDAYPLAAGQQTALHLSELNAEVKWRTYYTEQNSSHFKHLVPFSNYAKVMRGIATGDNNFFVFNESKAQQHNISRRCLMPCVCHSIDVEGILFTKSDFEALRMQNKKILLFDASNDCNNQCCHIYKER